MKLHDLALGVLVLIGGVAIYISALQFSPIPGQDYGAETMPKAIAFLAIALGLFLVAKGLATMRTEPVLVVPAWAHSPVSLARLALTTVLVVAYIVLSRPIGFVISAFALMAILMLGLRTRIVLAIPVAILATIVIQQAFGRLLLVPLPRSALLGFLW